MSLMPAIKWFFTRGDTPTEDPRILASAAALTAAIVTAPASLPFVAAAAGVAGLYEAGYWATKGAGKILERSPKEPKPIPLPTPEPPPPMPTREEIFAQYEQEYKDEVLLLLRLPLTTEEKEIVLEEAKNRFLARTENLIT